MPVKVGLSPMGADERHETFEVARVHRRAAKQYCRELLAGCEDVSFNFNESEWSIARSGYRVTWVVWRQRMFIPGGVSYVVSDPMQFCAIAEELLVGSGRISKDWLAEFDKFCQQCSYAA